MRYFIGRDVGGIVRDKQVMAPDVADAAILTYLANRPGWTATEVSQSAFDTFITVPDHQVYRAEALNEFAADITGNAKAIRAFMLVMLDEINVIRALLPGPPAPRTIAQLRTAVNAKINSGVAD